MNLQKPRFGHKKENKLWFKSSMINVIYCMKHLQTNIPEIKKMVRH